MASSSAPQPNTASVLSQPSSSQTLITNNRFKSSLIEFALKSKMKEPEFHSRNEGESHAPKYRSSVLVDGFVFTTEQTFFRRKDADQEVSRIALEQLTNKIIPEGYSLVAKSVTFCKATLNEYAAKLHMTRPTYNTVEYKSVIPYFVCTVDFNGTSYVGEAAGRKRDAENLAARSAILSFIGNSESGMILIRTIRAKAELFGSAIPRSPERLSDHLNVLPVKDTAQSHEHVHVLDDRDKDIIVPSATDNMNQIAVVRPEPRPNVSTIQQPEMPTHEPTPEATESTNEFQQPDAALPIDNVISAKKRKRNNYKANKRARIAAAAAQLNGLPNNQGAPCAAQ
ncbi:double-stranded RNA-binding protein 8-like [Trifolium pratense]|uniref:double-stranded RNA-binding protein 8-like n=1 Tax=Trifolium pratense TaxID=57577 RepID=UPI001E697A79|nr:double-stranded RNA-binding protein 8-like [Trifolium pratense]